MDAELGETDAAAAAQQTHIPVEVNAPAVPELSLAEKTQMWMDTGSGIREKSGSTKGVEWRTQQLRRFRIQVLELVEWVRYSCKSQ